MNPLVRKMLDAWYGDTEGMAPYDELQIAGMTAALKVAVEEALKRVAPSEDRGMWGTDNVDEFLSIRRDRALSPPTPSLSERIKPILDKHISTYQLREVTGRDKIAQEIAALIEKEGKS